MSMLYTTLRLLRQHDACKSSYTTLRKSLPARFGQDEAIPLMHILQTLNVQDTLWALRALHPGCEERGMVIARLMACDIVEGVLPIFEKRRPADTRPREAIAVTRRFAHGEATADELAAAEAAARAAAWAVAWAAAWDAAGPAAGTAAGSAAGAAARAAAGPVAWAAAWIAAGASARAAAGSAAWAAAGAAEGKAQSEIVFAHLKGDRP